MSHILLRGLGFKMNLQKVMVNWGLLWKELGVLSCEFVFNSFVDRMRVFVTELSIGDISIQIVFSGRFMDISKRYAYRSVRNYNHRLNT